MESHEVHLGMTVRIREDHRRPKLQGLLDTFQESFGAPEYLAVDVLLEDGRQELFWLHQLDPADQDLSTQDLSTPSVRLHVGS